jgi:hypothetical protein
MGWLALAAVAIGVSVATTVDIFRRWSELAIGDFETYWTGARRLLDGVPLYPPSQLDQPFMLGDAAFGRGFVYPPTAAVLSAPLAILPMPIAFVLFTAITAVALGSVGYAIARGEGVGRRAAVLIALILIGTGPGLDGLLTGNVNALAGAGLGLMWVRPRLSGWVSVIGGLVKVYPAIGIVWAIRRRAPVIGPVAAALAIIAISVLLAGPSSWNDFRSTMTNGLSNEYFPIQSPRSLLSTPLGVVGSSAVAFGLTAALLVVVLRLRDEAVAFALLGLAMIMAAPEWHLHYFIVPLVGALPLVLRRAVRARRTPTGDPVVAAPAPPG